jgi:beta-galactosidase
MRDIALASAAAAAFLTLVTAPAGAEIVPRSDLMSIGVYYYPEAWPEAQWARDLGNMRKMGFEYTHVAEFAWAFMEPEEGRFDLDWLERAVNAAGKAGLKVILCTPSATPPAWLVRAHPEVLTVDSKGRRMNHGSRAHATWSSETYRRYVVRIDTELAKRFGTNPHVWGWQIDNELSHYGVAYDYSDASRDAFRSWLQKRYPTIDALNKAWGNAFWSQMYQRFDQIDLPNPDELVAQVNPHARLDYKRWFAESAADYIRLQAETLRKHARNQWVTTNYMTFHDPISPALSGRDLEIMTSTMYPVAGYFNEPPLGFRLGDGETISLTHDFMRSINGQFGVMELQPGQVNWGTVNPRPEPGAIRMWILRAFALGSKLVCTYRYRQPLFGGELYHHGIVETDGVTPSPGGREYAQAIQDVALLRQHASPGAAEPKDYAARRTAILYNPDNRWDLDNWKQTVRWDTMAHLTKYYRALKGAGAPVDVIGEEKDFGRYPFLVAPSYQLVDEALVARWKQYVEGGGHLVLTSRTGQKDRMGQLREGPWAAAILDLVGADFPGYDVLPEPFKGTVKGGGMTYEWGVWADLVKPRPGTETLATYADQFYAGTAAAVRRKLGKGTVTYVGVESLSGDLENDVVRGVFGLAGVGIRDLPRQFFVDWRDGFWVATNFSSAKVAAPLPAAAKLLVGAREVPPAGIAIWTE